MFLIVFIQSFGLLTWDKFGCTWTANDYWSIDLFKFERLRSIDLLRVQRELIHWLNWIIVPMFSNCRVTTQLDFVLAFCIVYTTRLDNLNTPICDFNSSSSVTGRAECRSWTASVHLDVGIGLLCCRGKRWWTCMLLGLSSIYDCLLQ